MTNNDTLYCVRRFSHRDGNECQIASGMETMAEAAEVALRLTWLQEAEGGLDQFCAMAE